MPGDHFYTTDPKGELAPSSGYEHEGITGYVYKTPSSSSQPGTVPIYRWYNPKSGDHFYTADKTGELAPATYTSEGVGWYMFASPVTGTTPVFRWYNPSSGDHFYTTDATGELAPVSGYSFEGVLGYLYPREDSAASGTVPLFRWWHTGLMSKFTFSSDITAAQRAVLYERHAFGYYRAGLTTHLTAKEKSDVRALYTQAIAHGVNNQPGVNASAIVGGRQIWVNFGVLFPQGDREIAQTLLHEMMHCAGYTHPDKSGTPGDNGPYFGSAPLRAELAIAGVQSDVADVKGFALGAVAGHVCPVVDEEATRRIEAAAKGVSGGGD